MFAERFKDICNELKRTIPRPVDIPMYSIYKRSLPVGLDVKVVFGTTKEDAEMLLQRFLKTKMVEDANGENVIIYYDLIKDGDDKGIFVNPREILKTEAI